MITVSLPEALEAADADAAHRCGLSIDDYLTAVCADALSLEIDRARVDLYLAGTPAILHNRAGAWLTELVEGKRTECPR